LLKLKSYNDATTGTYCKAFHAHLHLLVTVPVSSLTKKQVEAYLEIAAI
jgi:hypothetical protein